MSLRLSELRGGVVFLLLVLSILFFPSMRVWAADSYTVKFLSSYGEYDGSAWTYPELCDSQTITDGDLITKPDINDFTDSYYDEDYKYNFYNKYFIIGWSTERDNIEAFKNQWNFDTDAVTEDISLYPIVTDYVPCYFKDSNYNIFDTFTKDPASNAAVLLTNVRTLNNPSYGEEIKDNILSVKIKFPDAPETDSMGRAFIGWSWEDGEGGCDYYEQQKDGSYRSLSNIKILDKVTIIPKDAQVYAKNTTNSFITFTAEYERTLTVKDAYYESDGTTLINIDTRSQEKADIGSTYSFDALSSKGYEYMGYSLYNIANSTKSDSTVSGTVSGSLTIIFKYKAVDSEPNLSGRVEIPVEIEADGTTKTDFVTDNTILGGDLIVSIPAEMILAYDADNEVMTKADYVSATGRCASTSKLEVKTLTSITYANDADNSIKVPGTIAFGTVSDTYQITEWSALELLTGVKVPADVVKKDISASVLKSDIDYVGTYSTSILYNISVLDKADASTT